MTEYVWIVAGGLLQVPAVEAARALGLSVIVSDRDPACACAPLADIFVALDTYDVAGHVDRARYWAKHLTIVGVFTEGADVEVTVAAMAEALGLPGIPVEAARACNDKAEMRRVLDWAGLSPLAFVEIGADDDAGQAARRVGYPLMVKAVDNCASRGVRRVNGPAELPAAVAYALAASRSGRVLLEEYLEGDQQSVEILFGPDGHCYWLNIVDRVFDGALELGHINPSGVGPLARVELFKLTEAAARACGVTFGAFKADTIWLADGRGARILEVTARLSGGFDCQYTTPLATGRNFIRVALAIACGRPLPGPALAHQHERHAVAWAAFPVAGRVVEIRPKDIAAPLEFVRVKVGDTVGEYQHNAERPGFVVTVADTRATALEWAQAAARDLAARIVTVPA